MDLSVTLHKSIRQRNKDEIVTDGLETGTVQVRMDEESARIKGVQKNALVMSMGTMALADGNGVASTNLTVTVKSESSGRQYTAYQIFTGDISSNTDSDTTSDVYANDNTRKLSNIQWAAGVDSTALIHIHH